MKEELYDDIFEDKEEQIDFKASLFKYIIRWPWFVASVIIASQLPIAKWYDYIGDPTLADAIMDRWWQMQVK